MRSFLLASALLLAACGNPTVIDGKSYSKTCTLASDCVGVFFGDQCSPCGCANAAVATSAKITYDADRSAAIAACGPRPAIACAACQEVVVKCTADGCGI
jgi:hypothetical protein